jgi:low affinity Fe/Cu permease
MGYWLSMRDASEFDDETPRWQRGMFGGAGVHASEWVERHWTSRMLHRVGEATAHARSGILAAGLVAAWTLLGVAKDFPVWWQTTLYSVAGSVTFVMVFVIQHTQQRQTAAIQRKLDELLRSSEDADSTVIAVEEAPDADLETLTRDHVVAREHAQRGH